MIIFYPSIVLFSNEFFIYFSLVGGFCPPQNTSSALSMLFGDYNWPETGGNSTALLSCVHGRQENGTPGGFAVRRCQAGGKWQDEDFSQCRDSKRKLCKLYPVKTSFTSFYLLPHSFISFSSSFIPFTYSSITYHSYSHFLLLHNHLLLLLPL